MNFAEFAGTYPWALTILKSELLLKLVESLESPRSVDELLLALRPLERHDIERAVRALEALGVARDVGGKYELTELGRQFIKIYRETF